MKSIYTSTESECVDANSLPIEGEAILTFGKLWPAPTNETIFSMY